MRLDRGEMSFVFVNWSFVFFFFPFFSSLVKLVRRLFLTFIIKDGGVYGIVKKNLEI